jgi:DNA (cytosine-5)-methyltransferase 1
MATQVSYLNIGEKKGNKRLWLEGKRMSLSGFDKGQKYKTVLDVQTKSLSLILDDQGDRAVSGRKRNGRVNPIIELCNASITQYVEDVLGGAQRVRVVFQSQKIKISVHHDEQARLRREAQTKDNLVQGILREATLCAGGGISSYALHEGFSDVGLHAISEFIVDMEGKYLQNAMDNNPYITDDTTIFEATLEEMEPELIVDVMGNKNLDCLNVSLPCTGHSLSGKAKNKLVHAEDHQTAGSAVIGMIGILKATNPSVVISENVPQFQTSATNSLIKGYLQKTGYDVQEKVVGREMGAFEERKRHIMVAISSGLSTGFDLDELTPSMVAPKTLSEIMDEIPEDSERWRTYEYLGAKAQRDAENGKGFKRQLVDGSAESIGTIGRGYSKCRSTEPFIKSPFDDQKSRLLTVDEHARAKGIPEDAVAGQSATVAHQILGQSVLFPVFKSIGRLIGSFLKHDIDIIVDESEPFVDQIKNIRRSMEKIERREQLDLFEFVEDQPSIFDSLVDLKKECQELQTMSEDLLCDDGMRM